MKALSCLSLLLLVHTPFAQNINIDRGAAQPALRWNGTTIPLAGATSEYQVQVSADLNHWTNWGTALRTSDPEELRLPFQPGTSPAAFFRLIRKQVLGPVKDSGAEVFGFSTAFRKHLRDIGEISVDEFREMFPTTTNYVGQIDFDPTTARFWNEFNTDPAEHNATLALDDPERRRTDFRLTDGERELFKKQGFVVSRRAWASFGDLLYAIYVDDMPLYLSSDLVLQAWHRSFANMLKELEDGWFAPTWQQILGGIASELATQPDGVKAALQSSFADCDYFLGVARSLAAGTNVPCVFGQDGAVAGTLADISSREMKRVNMFGGTRVLDFSKFAPRAYYTDSEELKRYFQTVMWLGQIDFRLTPPQDILNSSDVLRELTDAALLFFLLRDSGMLQKWNELSSVIDRFVGLPDSLNFTQLAQLLKAAGIESIADLSNATNVQRLQTLLLGGNFGVQEILGHYYIAPGAKVPRSFLVFGQRFTPDSWTLSKVVYDSILRDGEKVARRMPSPLDVGFAVLGNNATTPWIIDSIEGRYTPAVPQRDGWEYQHNLAAARLTIDDLPAAFWDKNIYSGWLGALRALTVPSATDARYPQALRTRAWAMKTLNTQLASWTQLRHTTVLYVKESMSGGILCSFPQVFVEPVPEFWKALERLAASSADVIRQITFPTNQIVVGTDAHGRTMVSGTTIQSNQVAQFERFVDATRTLRTISEKQLSKTALSAEETEFLQNVAEIQKEYSGLNFSGWLPNLFYRGSHYGHHPSWSFHQRAGISREDQLIVGVHTMPNDIDNGGILHQAVGRVHNAFVAVETNGEKTVFAGPVFSHYDLPTEGLDRPTNEEWKAQLTRSPLPARPPWTKEMFAE